MTIANAGHLSPYMDGDELKIAGALPLGVWMSRPAQRRRAGAVLQVLNVGQAVPKLAEIVSDLYVLQRHPNWCAPLHNRALTSEDMDQIRRTYDDIFRRCAETPGGFIHGPLPQRFH